MRPEISVPASFVLVDDAVPRSRRCCTTGSGTLASKQGYQTQAFRWQMTGTGAPRAGIATWSCVLLV